MENELDLKPSIGHFVLMSMIEHVATEMQAPDATDGAALLTALYRNVPKTGLDKLRIIIGSDLWERAFGSPNEEEPKVHSLTGLLDPVARYDLLETGHVGTMFGSKVLSPVYSRVSKAIAPNLMAVAALDDEGNVVAASKCYADMGKVVD